MRSHFTFVVLAASLLLTSSAHAQNVWHLQDNADMPPGWIGQKQLERGGPRPGYFQPVKVTGPEGTSVALAEQGGFAPTDKNSALAGMLIGQVYRLKVTGIPLHEGEEVYPSVEVIDRLYPPPGQAARFPIPIELTAEELEFALQGKYVMRVIYIEEPKTALPRRDEPPRQRYIEVPAGEDPLHVADRMGRPVAILRMGSRLPTPEFVDGKFLYLNPPYVKYEVPPPFVNRRDGLEPPLEGPLNQGQKSFLIPRLPAREMHVP
ncbi:hypothetical protein ETAA8_25520 [Anatilimnocola aggregata]|uniref:DUF4198 domain-containing protein n=1 Tax=Anatilimnocola aggregata TaxID=2528021 RepID=A0A517YB82_9BACT|nr:hypothetical protein [Anatilimnocola aggregata]QDU27464.1 hypothetical protein ETAA8_25520 [Anatilimnocola aggregata]